MQRADQHVALHHDLRGCALLREAPELAATGNRRIVVEIHRMDIDALDAVEADRIACPVSV